MTPIVSSTATMAEWQAMLDRIDESVTQALGDTVRRKRTLGDEPDSASFVGTNPDEIEARLAGLEERFDKAKLLAGEIETMLANDEREVQAWRDAAASARQRLDAFERL